MCYFPSAVGRNTTPKKRPGIDGDHGAWKSLIQRRRRYQSLFSCPVIEKGAAAMDEAKPAGKPPTGEDFDVKFAAVGNSSTLRRIWLEAYGNDYSQEVEPYSFVTLTLLRRIAQQLRVGPGQSFADLGCGRGGPGLWVARELGASLI